mmetsp:Transcript_40306/g.38780  ORF Transcript_40306/g.38780 Transcript_40306/m.38780 type:complete len:81 (-) Transcript_40306:683-925(-)
MAKAYQREKPVVDDSGSMQERQERVVSSSQKQVMDARAQAFLNKQSQMKEEIKRKELEHQKLVDSEKNYQDEMKRAMMQS